MSTLGGTVLCAIGPNLRRMPLGATVRGGVGVHRTPRDKLSNYFNWLEKCQQFGWGTRMRSTVANALNLAEICGPTSLFVGALWDRVNTAGPALRQATDQFRSPEPEEREPESGRFSRERFLCVLAYQRSPRSFGLWSQLSSPRQSDTRSHIG